MTTLRFKMVEEAIGRKAVEVKAPAERPAEYFGKYVFDRDIPPNSSPENRHDLGLQYVHEKTN